MATARRADLGQHLPADSRTCEAPKGRRSLRKGRSPNSDHQAQPGRGERGVTEERAKSSQRAKPQLRPPGTAGGGERWSDEVHYAGVTFNESIARNKPHRTINLPDTNGGNSLSANLISSKGKPAPDYVRLTSIRNLAQNKPTHRRGIAPPRTSPGGGARRPTTPVRCNAS